MTDDTANTEQSRVAADCPNERLVMPTCDTCEYWKFGHEFNHGDADLPYCTEMRFWVNMMGTTYPHTPSDFGCNRHSDFLGHEDKDMKQNEKEALQAELDELQAELDELQAELAELSNQNPEKWEPRGGRFYISYGGCVLEGTTTDYYRMYGSEAEIEEHAVRRRDKVRTVQRLDAWVCEHYPDYVPDWNNLNEKKWYTYFSHSKGRYLVESVMYSQYGGLAYLPTRKAAERLAAARNSGEVE